MSAAGEPLPERVGRFLDAHAIDGRIVVGVSGGPDSVALLRALVACGADVHLGHLNHGLRPEAGEDEEFVVALAGELGLGLTVERVDVAALHSGASLENTARDLRRRFLEETAEAVGAAWVALGHTADDQAETVLLNLLRGAGPDGFAGIRAVAGPIVRPLLGVRRAGVLAYLEGVDAPYRTDESNRDVTFRRNRVRHELLPLLAGYNPAIVDTLNRTAELMRLVGDWSDAELARLPPPPLPTAVLDDLPRYLALSWVRRAAGELSFDHAGRVLDLAPGQSVELPGGVRARHTGDTIEIGPPPAPAPAAPELAVAVPGTVQLPGLDLTLAIADPPADRRTAPDEAYLDWERLSPPLAVRARRPGDRFHPLGAPGPQKLKQFLIDRHVPREQRDAVPLLVDQEGIVCVVGHRIADRVKLGPTTTRVVHLRIAARS